ncbi:MAG: sensor histidine kinase [Oscillospiraceae bacterium]
MKSMHSRQFALMASMVLISFILFGGAFAALSFHYTLQEKQESLERNAGFIADFTSAALVRGLTVDNEYFQSYVASISSISDATILLTSADGLVVFASSANLVGKQVPASTLDQMLQSGQYNALSNLGGLFRDVRYVSGLPIQIPGQEKAAGLVFVAAEADSIMEMWRSLVLIFIFTALVVVFIASIISSVTSLYQTKPLKEMAEATRKFAHGDFEVRVNTDGRRDEIGELAASFNTMAESLAKSEARRSEFVANVSHELKTPMTTIAGFADGILDGTIPPERQEEALRTISAETRRLSRLVRRMLDLSRLQSAETVTAQEPFDICETMARILVSLETKITAKGLDVHADIPEEPLMVWGEADAITQVGYNLLDNAIKFSRPGGRLGVSITTKGSKAYISVSDEGDTIPPEELPMIFDRFHKTDHSRSVDREGVGLGLYIVKTILNNHKEDITVTSQDGLTEFTFTLTKA